MSENNGYPIAVRMFRARMVGTNGAISPEHAVCVHSDGEHVAIGYPYLESLAVVFLLPPDEAAAFGAEMIRVAAEGSSVPTDAEIESAGPRVRELIENLNKSAN